MTNNNSTSSQQANHHRPPEFLDRLENSQPNPNLKKAMTNSDVKLCERVNRAITISDEETSVYDFTNNAGTMQILDVRHIELFLCQGYLNGSWDYELLGTHDFKKCATGASGAIFDSKNLKDQSTAGLHVKDHAMKAGKKGDIVSIRISQQLL